MRDLDRMARHVRGAFGIARDFLDRRRLQTRAALDEPTHSADGHNPLCGDILRVQLAVEDERVADVAFTGSGCAISTASASLMTEAVKGKTLAEAEALFGKFHTMVTSDHDQGAIASRRLSQRVQHPAHLLVHRSDLPVVLGDVVAERASRDLPRPVHAPHEPVDGREGGGARRGVLQEGGVTGDLSELPGDVRKQ